MQNSQGDTFDVIIIGGGIAGLITATILAKEQLNVLVIEQKGYPRHKVCGEYVSNEVKDWLSARSLFPAEFNPPEINKFYLTDIKGRGITMPLEMGGFGISRYRWDQLLYQRAQEAGAEVLTGTKVEGVHFQSDSFRVETQDHRKFISRLVIGAHGKRSSIDKKLDRSFMQKRHPYIGVKYHFKGDYPDDLIALHNFEGGYCGISRVEEGLVNVCYLSRRENLQEYGSVEAMEKYVLRKNPALSDVLDSLEMVYDKPLVINEISFDTKKPVESHVLMCGDAAGMITPLCGNGMAMAVRSVDMLSDTILKHGVNFDRTALEVEYTQRWKAYFAGRLRKGRMLQRLFGNKAASGLAVSLARSSDTAARLLIRQSHGSQL